MVVKSVNVCFIRNSTLPNNKHAYFWFWLIHCNLFSFASCCWSCLQQPANNLIHSYTPIYHQIIAILSLIWVDGCRFGCQASKKRQQQNEEHNWCILFTNNGMKKRLNNNWITVIAVASQRASALSGMTALWNREQAAPHANRFLWTRIFVWIRRWKNHAYCLHATWQEWMHLIDRFVPFLVLSMRMVSFYILSFPFIRLEASIISLFCQITAIVLYSHSSRWIINSNGQMAEVLILNNIMPFTQFGQINFHFTEDAWFMSFWQIQGCWNHCLSTNFAWNDKNTQVKPILEMLPKLNNA